MGSNPTLSAEVTRESGRERSLERLRNAVAEYVRTIDSLTPDAFLDATGGWSPRDVTAHLVGWLDVTIAACEEIRAGRPPGYLDDARNDYATVNAGFVRRFDATDRAAMVARLRGALGELLTYARAVPPAEWDRDTGVRFEGGPVTVDNTIGELARDIKDHRRQLAEHGHP